MSINSKGELENPEVESIQITHFGDHSFYYIVTIYVKDKYETLKSMNNVLITHYLN